MLFCCHVDTLLLYASGPKSTGTGTSTPSVAAETTPAVSNANDGDDAEVAAGGAAATADADAADAAVAMDAESEESDEVAADKQGAKEHKNSRKRKDATVASKSTIITKPKRQPTKPSSNQIRRFLKKTSYEKNGEVVNPSKAPYGTCNGHLFCDDKKGGCGIIIGWDNRAKHLTSKAHKNKVKGYAKRQSNSKAARKLAQDRIEKGSLIGSTYTDDAIDRDITYTRMFFAGNIGFESIAKMKVRNYLRSKFMFNCFRMIIFTNANLSRFLCLTQTVFPAAVPSRSHWQAGA